MLPIADPYANLPSPSVAVDPTNVVATNYGGVNVVSIPSSLRTTVLNPGVYDWIQVTSGAVVFNPGVYIIRNVNPDADFPRRHRGTSHRQRGHVLHHQFNQLLGGDRRT